VPGIAGVLGCGAVAVSRAGDTWAAAVTMGCEVTGTCRLGGHPMSDPHLDALRKRAAGGDTDAIAELVELSGERGDLAELRRLADAGSSDAVDVMVELAGERGDLAELRRLTDAGSSDAAAVLAELLDGEGEE
jgi:hypothetical protein